MQIDFVRTCPVCDGQKFVPFMETTDFRATHEAFALLRCAGCGLVVTQPQPTPDVIGGYYETEDYISHAARARSAMDSIYYGVRSWMAKRKHGLLRKFARGKNLVDIGAGSGHFAAHMRQEGWSVEALEPSANARKVAHEMHGINLHDTSQLFEFPDGQADVVTMWHVLEHVHDPNAYLQEIFRVLTFNGVLFLALPNHKSTDAAFYGHFWGAWDVPRHLWHFHPGAVAQILRRHGFNIVKRYRMPFDAFYVAFLSEKYKKRGWLLRGFLVGACSVFVSLFSIKRSSSVIYVVRKD